MAASCEDRFFISSLSPSSASFGVIACGQLTSTMNQQIIGAASLQLYEALLFGQNQ
jgi:hypothetical protein